ncbi:MAG: hypothetical protein ACOYYF_17235 [Chloroflexota bacterium]|jgi:hypothetical protein
MCRPISNEALHILRYLSRASMTIQQLSEYRKYMPIQAPVDTNSVDVNREMQLLQRWGLIKWVRQPGGFERIYHITEVGRRFLKDCIFIESINLFEEYHGFASSLTMLDVLEKDQRSQFIKKRRGLVYKIIGKIKKSQSVLGKKEKARQLFLQYHLHRLQGELRWLEDIIGSQGA